MKINLKSCGNLKVSFIPFILSILIIFALLVPSSFYVVKPGFAAIHLRLGKILETQATAGYYFKFPLVDSIIPFDMRIKKATIETNSLSKDLQGVSVGMAVNYRIESAYDVYKNIGINFESIIINPFVQESVKAIVAKFDAESLIQHRHEAKEMVISELIKRLSKRDIQLVDFNFTHLDFSSEFIRAVEAKQIAEQSAKQAGNLTKKVREEAVQANTRAEAEAFALKVKRESVTKELIELKKVEAQLKAIEKWDGKLPKFTGGSIPLLPILNQGNLGI